MRWIYLFLKFNMIKKSFLTLITLSTFIGFSFAQINYQNPYVIVNESSGPCIGEFSSDQNSVDQNSLIAIFKNVFYRLLLWLSFIPSLVFIRSWLSLMTAIGNEKHYQYWMPIFKKAGLVLLLCVLAWSIVTWIFWLIHYLTV